MKKVQLKLDYKLKTSEERIEFVNQLLTTCSHEYLTPTILEYLSDYILFIHEKANQKTKKYILTDNRCLTIYKRETSYEALVEKFETGEDGVYNLIADENNFLLCPKQSITPEDLEAIPELKDLHNEINKVETKLKTAEGRRKYLLKKQLIEMRQDQYVIKNSRKPPIQTINRIVKSLAAADLTEHITFDAAGEPVSDCLINLFNPTHVSALLRHYSQMKQDTEGKVWADSYYMMMDFDNLAEAALAASPYLYDLAAYKIDGLTNIQIQQKLFADYNIYHTVEYISALWRKKIPKLIAEKAKEEYLLWYYRNIDFNPEKWKKCSRCGQEKLRLNRFFSKNNTSKDGFYSICKECRRKK